MSMVPTQIHFAVSGPKATGIDCSKQQELRKGHILRAPEIVHEILARMDLVVYLQA